MEPVLINYQDVFGEQKKKHRVARPNQSCRWYWTSEWRSRIFWSIYGFGGGLSGSPCIAPRVRSNQDSCILTDRPCSGLETADRHLCTWLHHVTQTGHIGPQQEIRKTICNRLGNVIVNCWERMLLLIVGKDKFKSPGGLFVLGRDWNPLLKESGTLYMSSGPLKPLIFNFGNTRKPLLI